MKVGEAISRLRTLIKAVKQDSALSDRFLYSLIMKYGKLLMRRQDNLGRIMAYDSIFQSLNYIPLIEVDKTQASCFGVQSSCYFRRTKDKLPNVIQGYWGPLIKNVMSLGMTLEFKKTFPMTFSRISNQKTFFYNKTKYFWYSEGYLYFPNIDYDAIRLDGVFEGDISKYVCNDTPDCMTMQDMEISVPDYMFADIEKMALQELMGMMNVPLDTQHDQKSVTT